MALRSRTRLQLRRTVVAAALGALFVPAVADAKTKTPVITKVTPKLASVGTKMTITGKNFRRGKAKNSVLFRRDKGKALFVKADVSTTRKLTVIVPKTLEKYMLVQGKTPIPTRFKLRVLAAKLTKAYTSSKLSPVIGPEKPADGDCDSDGVKNSAELDDDNDLLADSLEIPLLLDPCSSDTDGDGVEDGFEYKSARDLNNDDYQSPNTVIPYPAKTPYPNPLFKDADVDYDGDSLSQLVEYQLWKYTYEVNHTATRTLWPLSYSDGSQFSLWGNVDGTRTPRVTAAEYQPPQRFRELAAASGYGRPNLFSYTNPRTLTPYDLFDADRDPQTPPDPYYWTNGSHSPTAYVSDDERDEDVDGLSNFDENTGRMAASWWAACYSDEKPYPITFSATKPFDADTDGDGVLDGADDQDFDDIPNIMELSRNDASGGLGVQGQLCAPASGAVGYANPMSMIPRPWVNPYNPCLPDRNSRSCPLHPLIGQAYPPFINDWKPYILN
jgi:hypothetical protein